MPLPRARVVTLNAALGPARLSRARRHGRSSRARSSSRRSGRGSCSASRGSPSGCQTEEVGDNRLRPLAGVRRRAAHRRAAPAAVRMDRRLLSQPPRLGAADGAALVGRARRPAPAHRISADRAVPDRLTPQREKALAAIEGRQGTIRELADHAEVSDAVMRGLVNAGALEAVAVDADRPLACPDPDFAPPDLNDDQREAAASLAAAVGKGFDPVLLDGVTGSGKTEVYFEAIAECLRQGKQALVLLPEIALTEPFLKRFEARFGCAPVAWHSDLRSSQRRRAWRGIASGEAAVTVGARSALFLPYPKLGLIVVDEAHEPCVQAGGRRPVSRPRHGGDARPSSRTFR